MNDGGGAPRVRADALRDLSARALRAAGVPEPDAAIVARVMTANEMRGISHGVALLAPYIRHIRAGGMTAAPRIAIERDVGATLVLNGDAGLGPLIAHRAMELAIERARRYGVAFVVARDGNNFAAAGYYAKMAADAGMAGVAMTNADPTMAVAGGAGRTVGNNPLACAVPGPGDQAVYLDLAMSAVAGTKLAIAAREGRSIPEGWALDAGGAPTNDPRAMKQGGSLVPFGGYKGSGLALLIECLTGVLGGAAIMAEMRDWGTDPAGRSDQAHSFIAVDIEPLLPLAEFKARMARLARQVRGARRAPGVDRIYLPGDIEHEKERDALRNGVPLRGATVAGLRDLGEMVGLAAEVEALLAGATSGGAGEGSARNGSARNGGA